MDSNSRIRITKNSNKKQSSSQEDFSIKRENPKKKLFAALDNLNDELNIRIDSKDKLFTDKLNLECISNRKSSENKSKSPEEYINNENINKLLISPSINKENEFQPFIKTEESRDERNIRKINTINSKDLSSGIKTDPNRLKKYINSSKNSINSKSKNSENNINEKINKKSIQKIINENKSDKESDNKIVDIIDSKSKITLHNLNKEDKFLLKDMEAKHALLVTDISSLNKKSLINYNISLSNFNLQKILDYYVFLANENEKKQKEVNTLRNEVSELKEKYLKIKKDEINNNNEIDIDLNIDDYNNSAINFENLSPVSRYKNDLHFFENLIIGMKNEIKNT